MCEFYPKPKKILKLVQKHVYMYKFWSFAKIVLLFLRYKLMVNYVCTALELQLTKDF